VIGGTIASSRTARWRERVTAVIAALERFPLSILQFIFRFSIGSVFWNAGLTKIMSWQTTVVLFRDEYRVPILPPEIAADLATAIELSCPILLVLGLGARLATLPMLAQTLVIEVFVYPEDWIEHLMWVAMLLFILSRGPGVISVDRWIRRAVLGR
jgi:putative oxidoreductase